MSEENNGTDARQAALERNVSNNAKNVRAAAEIASKTDHPYAKAAGMAIKAADKISGGKASEKLGKMATNYMKSQGLKGKMMQAALNKMSESGTSDRLASAMSKKNGAPGSASPNGSTPKSAKVPDAGTETKIKDQAEETAANEGSGSVDGSTSKIVKYGLLGCAAIFPLIIFAVLFTGASQVFVNSISLGTADSLSGEEAEEKINKKGDEGIEEEKSDDDVAYDIYINDETILTFKNSNIVQVASEKKYLRRKYNEATLEQIEDFYPSVKDASKNYDENMVYDFFYKMYNLYISYRDNYDVYLDLPLLMSTLNLQSSDKNVVFSSNLSPEDRKKTARKLPIDEYDYYHDWAGHTLDPNDSTHDMEILVQRMVSYQVKETCVDSSGKVTEENILRDNQVNTQVLVCKEGETYKTETLGMQVDHEKYKEFLKEFIEKKYYLKEKIGISANPVDGIAVGTLSVGNSFAEAFVNLANSEYQLTNGEKGGMKYINAYGGFGPGTPWCAIFVSYLTANTHFNGQTLYPDIIPFRSASTGSYINYFNTSDKSNINFYYNDNCKNLKGKNGGVNYIPKAGDFIFFDWQAQYYDISSKTQDHVAIVEKYEDGTIYTIEGNLSNTVKKSKYPINDCRVIGFGSWY